MNRKLVVAFAVGVISLATTVQLPVRAGVGRRVVFTRAMEDTVALYSVNPDGSDPIQLTTEGMWAQDPAISPDGSRVAFASCPRRCNIFVANLDGSALTQLTSGRAIETYPVWSPDGSKIAYSRAVSYGAGAALYVMNSDGSGQTSLTTDRWYNSFPSWSPAGSEMVFVRFLRGDYELFRISTETSEVTRFTDNRGNELWPQWSPDGARIIYSLAPPSFEDYEIISIDPNGTTRSKLTDNRFRDDMAPQWAPGADRISFVRCQGTTCHLYAMNPDGSGKKLLVEGGVENLSHAWSPDGSRIALTRLNRRDRYDVFAVGPDGSDLDNLTQTRRRDEATVEW